MATSYALNIGMAAPYVKVIIAPDYAAKSRPAVSGIGGFRPERGIIRLSACAGLCRYRHNPAERAMRPIALGRKNYLFMGSASGGRAAAIAYTLIETARLNHVDPQAWLAQVLERIPDYKINRVDELLPWNYTPNADQGQIA